MTNLTRCLFLILLSICLTLLTLEFGFRGVRWLFGGPESMLTVVHPILGWDVGPNVRFSKWAKDASGKSYRVDYETDGLGFRISGKTLSDRPKIMFLGDSITHALAISNAKTYYGVFAARFTDLNVLGYGCSGWGTFQELLKLREVQRIIDPDIVVIQLCSNDFINNHYELERASTRSNNGARRPYLTVDGDLVYLTPATWPELRDLINKYSRLLSWGIPRWDRLMASRLASVEDDIKSRGLGHRGFAEAIAITEELMARIRVAAGGASVVAFSADNGQPYAAAFKGICDRLGIPFIEGVSERISSAKQAGACVYEADGGHWSETGHALCAEVLINYFTETDVLKVRPKDAEPRIKSH